MGGANLEVWKFGFYTLFPLATLYYFSDDDWYNKHVVPYGRKIWPEYEKTNRPPHTQQEIQAELARMKLNRQSTHQASSSGSSSSAGITEGDVHPSALSHGMRAAASSGIFGLGEVAAPTLSLPVAPAVSTDEVQGGARTNGTTAVMNVPGGLGYRNDEAEGGRIGTRVGSWREADRERLV